MSCLDILSLILQIVVGQCARMQLYWWLEIRLLVRKVYVVIILLRSNPVGRLGIAVDEMVKAERGTPSRIVVRCWGRCGGDCCVVHAIEQ